MCGTATGSSDREPYLSHRTARWWAWEAPSFTAGMMSLVWLSERRASNRSLCFTLIARSDRQNCALQGSSFSDRVAQLIGSLDECDLY
jgi:hypothetical protein